MINSTDDSARRQLEPDLRAAWAEKRFSLVYQPQVNLRTSRVTGFEALLRWHHPVAGDISPSRFIPVAEDIGLIDEIGQWVLQRACHEAASWPGPLRIAVNMSAIQVKNPALPAIVAAALKDSGLAPSRLELEVTETTMMPQDPADLATLSAIKQTGVRIVMDDFDVGYSALGYLISFQFNKVKLDQSFISKISDKEPRHDIARAIVKNIVNLCADIGMVFLAEGVETPEQLAILAALHCTEAQGILFGPPLPAAHIPGALGQAGLVLYRPDLRAAVLAPDRSAMNSSNIPFRQIADTTNDIVIVTTADLEPPGPTIVYVNAAFTRLTGYSAAEAIGCNPRMLQGPGTSTATRDALSVALREGRPVREKILNYAKSGAPYWLDMNIVALRDARGAITHFAAIERDVTMDKRRLDELEHLADRDTLTGIPNRRAFLRAMEAEIAESAEQGLCLAFIDVDHFKQINDRLGHTMGDIVLCGMADCLLENIRRADILGRIGGEEFAVCMPSVTLEEGYAFAERLRHAVAAGRPATPSGPVDVTVSIGVARFAPGDTASSMMERADAAMYAAKRAGRNRVRVEALRIKPRAGKVPRL
jgi:diguanylate cyclase (GGDEF)-like protein/PAS domain S-box-containing protein